MKFSVGIGITNRCNYNCKHCYSRKDPPCDMSFEQIEQLCENLDIEAINLGTGESGLHKDFFKIIKYIYDKGIKMSITSNGYTLGLLGNEELKMFNDIDLSLDFPEEGAHDDFRAIGATRLVLRSVERCKKLGVEVSFACAMMKKNYLIMDKMVNKAQELDMNLRINVYKPVYTRDYSLSYDEFWEGIGRLFANSKIISCSEPIINALINNKTLDGGSPCGKISMRINPNGDIVGCVYLKETKTTINDLVKNKQRLSQEDFASFTKCLSEDTKIVPQECKDCVSVDVCKGGCLARRIYNGNNGHNGINKPDEYCFRLNGRTTPQINYQWGELKDLVHSGYLCTIIVC